ncbi:hypothetical protein ERX46_00045 [Brumimicrobium glaciale]|uniref:Uncharacterized protein n=1 Tax=Brumimicrobium glaciale TaxID=200475 RepID=A0A4Q4KPN6_9FLAO|nr:hypothetical protein [Brumimicrobium glaciale]RYM35416.1 hypothetical protein ERX46_00045 [Brumimicrobium glaciale]
MAQFLLNISDKSKAEKLFEFLSTLNYLSIEALSEEEINISEDEKGLMISRFDNAKEKDFTDLDDIMKKYNIK